MERSAFPTKHLQEAVLDLTIERKTLKEWMEREAYRHPIKKVRETHTRLKRIEKVLNYYYIKRKGL